jgi:hypothetical protein
MASEIGTWLLVGISFTSFSVFVLEVKSSEDFAKYRFEREASKRRKYRATKNAKTTPVIYPCRLKLAHVNKQILSFDCWLNE